MSSEQRRFRPFSVGSLESALSGVVLSCGSLLCKPNGIMSMRDKSFSVGSLRLAWPAATSLPQELRRCVRDADLPASSTCLTVTARSAYLKIHEVLFRENLHGLDSLSTTLPLACLPDGTPSRIFSSTGRDIMVDAYVALESDVKAKKPLQPSRKGMWLARASFRLRAAERTVSMFKPLPLDQETKKQMRLPLGTMSYVDAGDCLLDEPAGIDNLPTLWVDQGILTDLAANPKSPAGVLMQKYLALEVVRAVIHEYSRRHAEQSEENALSEVDDPSEGSLIYNVARVIAGRRAPTGRVKEAKQMCRVDPERAVAHIEHEFRLLSTVRTTMEASP